MLVNSNQRVSGCPHCGQGQVGASLGRNGMIGTCTLRFTPFVSIVLRLPCTPGWRVQCGTARRGSHPIFSRCMVESRSTRRIRETCAMNIVVLLIILLLLFGGGGFYLGGPII